MGPNTTGKPNTNDYNLGRGICYFAALDANDAPTAYRDLGNATEFNISLEVETLEHQSSRSGLKLTDKEVIISQKVNISLTLDEVNFENLADFLSGSTAGTSATDNAGHLNPAVAGVTEFEFIAPGEVVLGRWYDLTDSSGNRVYDIVKANLTVKDEASTTYSEGTDYEVDEEMGRIFLVPTAQGGSIATGGSDGVDIALAADASADNYVPEVKALTQTTIAGALKFIAENPADSDSKTEFQFHKVSLKAEGDFGLISDEYSEMTFTAVAERSVLADADSPTLTVRSIVSPQT
jgi:hypothetical protein